MSPMPLGSLIKTLILKTHDVGVNREFRSENSIRGGADYPSTALTFGKGLKISNFEWCDSSLNALQLLFLCNKEWQKNPINNYTLRWQLWKAELCIFENLLGLNKKKELC